MNFRFSTAVAALGCVFLASCYPYNENQRRKQTTKPAEKSLTSAEQQKLKEQRDKLKAEEEKKATDTLVEKNPESTGTGPTTTDTNKTGGDEKRTDYAFANKVPGKEGFVFSPYNNKIVDVRDIPSGTLVQDPTYTGAGKGYFRVP
jgi:outer membrane biosynthesis protein TonB